MANESLKRVLMALKGEAREMRKGQIKSRLSPGEHKPATLEMGEPEIIERKTSLEMGEPKILKRVEEPTPDAGTPETEPSMDGEQLKPMAGAKSWRNDPDLLNIMKKNGLA